MPLQGSPTPWSYVLIRLLFRFVLKIFYGTIVVENTDLIPQTGRPCIVCANHSNSLTDALLLVTSIPSRKRNMLRLTAKATQFGRRTFTSWLIEAAGTVPIKRRKDYAEEREADNTEVMEKLMQALELGDAVCLFPEGMSRYHPTIAPLKTGVARIVSDILSRNRNDLNFEIDILPCSVTYILTLHLQRHRQHFRSDVLVTFHAPITFSPKDNPELLAPVDFDNIRAVTTKLQEKISSGTCDSPSWDLIRTAKLAARMYAPLGTMMTLGDHVRLTRTFLEAFKNSQNGGTDEVQKALNAYQAKLGNYVIKDDRIRRPLPRRIIISRLLVRFTWSICLFTISLTGLLLWLPVFATTFYAVHNFKKTGPIFDTWDEIAQYKLIYGLMSGICVWIAAVVFTWPVAPASVFLVPAFMWMTLRWFEDAVAAFRAFTSLARLLFVGKAELKKMHEERKEVLAAVMNLAVDKLGLPEDPETYFATVGGREKGRVQGSWDGRRRYFSIRRRRKRDWNETLRLYDQVDYPLDPDK